VGRRVKTLRAAANALLISALLKKHDTGMHVLYRATF